MSNLAMNARARALDILMGDSNQKEYWLRRPGCDASLDAQVERVLTALDAARAEEREVCAQAVEAERLCAEDERHDNDGNSDGAGTSYNKGIRDALRAIRARGGSHV